MSNCCYDNHGKESSFFSEKGNGVSNQMACLHPPSKSAALAFSIIFSPLPCQLEKVACKDIWGFTFIKSCYLGSLKNKSCKKKISKWPLRVLTFLIKQKKKSLLPKAKWLYLETHFFYESHPVSLTSLKREIYSGALCSHKSHWSINLWALVALETVLYLFLTWLRVLRNFNSSYTAKSQFISSGPSAAHFSSLLCFALQ